ncbi:unnamed protein product [Bursaphelenchus xylophilus]|uniref:(pine wood nematode) hypothetical protein n=1 Tax=Bursaphelenchus xylophilus TaxID=6326 RepID=A0A1I7SQQ6_BURXY|nr:unnamed protein product [Bursaphelenchus xylophilus]CAG9110241.1 unnamed protein product [Bursaphelenchus xylophilus]
MAKQIRNCYVHKKYNRWWRYLPRRQDGKREYDFEKNEALPENFEEKMDGEPPKLWVAWLYRSPQAEPKWTQARVKTLFGENFEPGKMTIFRNTADVNLELWKIKHLIDLKPLTFPNGEPTEADIPHLTVNADGQVIINREARTNDLPLIDEKKGFHEGYLRGFYTKRFNSLKDVYPDTVYNPSKITIMD